MRKSPIYNATGLVFINSKIERGIAMLVSGKNLQIDALEAKERCRAPLRAHGDQREMPPRFLSHSLAHLGFVLCSTAGTFRL